VPGHERGQPGHVLAADRVALAAQLVQGGVPVGGVPQHDAVEHQAQGPQLGLDPRVIALVDVSLAAMEDLPGQPLAALLQVADALDVTPVGLVVEESQDVEGLEDPAPGGDRLAQPG
jgi:hypothetical protein